MMIVTHLPWLLEPNFLTLFIRTLLALVCGGVIGYNRNLRGASAGMRTHILVCVGSMLAMSTGQFAAILYQGVDATRIGASVVSGIGFLGAGSIIITRDNHISGLTTAAGLWASGCIGLAIGISFFEGAILGTAAVLFTEAILRRISKSIAAAHRKSKDTPPQETMQDEIPE